MVMHNFEVIPASE